MLFGSKRQENINAKKTSIYGDIADMCRKLEYLIRIDVDGSCGTDDFAFGVKTAKEHMNAMSILTDRIKSGTEKNNGYAALVACDITEFYNAYITNRVNADILMNAKLARLELSIMAELKTFELVNQRKRQIEIVSKEKDSINKIMSVLAQTAKQEKTFKAFKVYSMYSDALSGYIKQLGSGSDGKSDEIVVAECDNKEPEAAEQIQPSDNSDNAEQMYKAAEKITSLSEKVRTLEFELGIKKSNEKKLQDSLAKKDEEILSLKAKAARAETDRAQLLTDIDSVKRAALAQGRIKVNLPLISISGRTSEDVWEEPKAKANTLCKIISMFSERQGDKKKYEDSGINIDAYECQIVSTADNLIPLGDSPFVAGYTLYRDTGGRHYFTQKSAGKSVKGKIMNIHIGPIDEMLLTHKFSDAEFLSYCNEHPKVCEVLPDFYNFMTAAMKLYMWEGDADTNDIVNFNMYYVHLIVILKDFVKQQIKLCMNAMALATELLMLEKCCGEDILDEAGFVQKISDYLICNDKDMVKIPNTVSGMMSSSAEASEYLSEIQKNISAFPDISLQEEKVCPVDTQKQDTQKNKSDGDIKQQNPFKQTYQAQTHINVDGRGSGNKYRRAFVPDIRNIKFIVSRTSASGGEDTSTYAVENIDSAVAQYCFMECISKKIGILIEDKKYYIMASDNKAASSLLLSERDKRFIHEEGVLDIVEFYEYKLLNAVKTAEEEI